MNASSRARFPAALASVLLLPVCLHAAVDDFTGYTTTTGGQNGGSASGGVSWTGAWGTVSQSAAIINGSMGGISAVNSVAPYAEFTLNTANTLEATRTLTLQSNEAEVWVYALVGIGKTGGIATTNSFGGIGLFNGTAEKFILGQRFQQTVWGAQGTNPVAFGNNSTVAIGNFDEAVLVGKINQQANTFTLWVNPDFSLTESANTPAFSINYGAGDDSFDTLRLRAGSGNTGNTFQFDNVNVTHNTPFIPEPSTALVMVSGLGMLGILRRRQ